MPSLEAPIPLEQLLAAPFEGARIALHPDPDAGELATLLGSSKRSVPDPRGARGGFTEEEVELARRAGEIPARLGRSILRIEMAAIAAAAIARYGSLAF